MNTTRRHFLAQTATLAFVSVLRAAVPSGKTILLQSAWDTVNIGDIGHTPGTLRILEEHLPEVPVVLWAMQLDERVTTMLKRRFPRVTILQGNPAGTTAADKRLGEAIRSASLFIRNSGMGQNIDWMRLCRELGTPYGLYGQSFFPNAVEGGDARERIALLDAAAFVYCRDSRTLATLKKAGVKSPVLEFGPDGCFGIDVHDDQRGLATMRELGLEEGKFITLQLRTHTAKHEGKDNPPLNPLHATPAQVADDERRAAKFRELINLWVKRTGGKVLIAPEVKKEMVHNKRLIFDRLPPDIQKHVVNLKTFWNANEAASIFARATAVIRHEPHAPIIALVNGTPIIHTYSEFHSPKCWMFEDIGLGEWLLEMDETPVEKMVATLFAIHDDPAAARAKVNKAMAFVKSQWAESAKVIRRSLRS